MNEDPKHPVQPLLEDEKGVLRFKRNKIIDWLFSTGKLDLNQVALLTARGQFPKEDEEQLAQLLGYSLSGFGDLSYVSEETYQRAEAQLKKEDLALKYARDKLNMSHTIRHCYESDPEPRDQDKTDLYLEQGEAGKNYGNLVFVAGMGQFTLTFVNSQALRKLSDFLMEAARKLESCTKEQM